MTVDIFMQAAWVPGLMTIGVVAATYALVATRWRSVQGAVPRQFDLLGRPCGWSRKWVLWFYPSFALVFVVGMTLIVTATTWALAPTPPSEYPMVAEGVAAVSLLIAVCMLFLTERSIAIAQKRATGLGWMFLPCLAVALTLLILHY